MSFAKFILYSLWEDGEIMKKKKLTYNSLAMSTLKNRKKSYALMIIGIVLSMIFSSSIIYFAFSAYETSQEQIKADKGLFDMYSNDYDTDWYEKAQNVDAIDTIGYGNSIGFAFTDSDNKLNGTSVAKLDEVAKELVNPVFIKGSYPKNKGEIAIEQSTLLQLGIVADIGDEITLEFQVQNDDELLPEIKEKTYKLTGILRDKRNNFNLGFDENHLLPAAFVSDYETVDLGGKENVVAYCTLTDSGWFSMYDIVFDETNYIAGDFVFGYSEMLRLNSDESVSLFYIIIIIAILLVASSVGIINTFTSNLKERKKQIGLYRSVGATKKQIFTLFSREALLLSIICTPISLLISFVIVKLIVNTIFEEAFFTPNLWVLLLCGAFSMICVLIASSVSVLPATRVTPMQAIRNIEAVRKFKNKKIKTQQQFTVSKLLAKRDLIISKRKQIVISIFLVIAIFSSSYIFSYLSYYKNDIRSFGYDYELLLDSDSGYFMVNYPESNNGFSENQVQTVLLNENIKSFSGQKRANINILINNPDELSDYRFIKYSSFDYKLEDLEKLDEDNYRKLLTLSSPFSHYDEGEDIFNAAGYNTEIITDTEIVALDDKSLETFNDYILDGSINIDKLNSGEEVILVTSKEAYLTVIEDGLGYGRAICTYGSKESIENEIKLNGYEVEIISSAECDYKAGETLDLSVLYCEEVDPDGDSTITKDNLEVNNKQVKIGAVVDDKSNSRLTYRAGIYTTLEGMKHFFPQAKYKLLTFDLKDNCTEEVDKEVTALLKSVSESIYAGSYQSDFESKQRQKEEAKTFFLLAFAILVLIFTICGSIINNVISSTIKGDKKKIGTLRAVGANEKEVSLSYIYQLLSMFIWGFVIGFGGFVISFLILSLIPNTKEMMNSLIFNPWVTLILAIILFAICSLSIYFKIKKEMKHSIVENIREL